MCISLCGPCEFLGHQKKAGRSPPSVRAYLRGGLLPRPPPEGLPVLLGPFSRYAFMVLLLCASLKMDVRGAGTYLAHVGFLV